MSVKCAGCTACCSAPIYRMPEDHLTLDWRKLPDGREVLYTMADIGLDGDTRCIYADTDEGCSVYPIRPEMCRLFDCRLALIKGLPLEPAIKAAAEERLGPREAHPQQESKAERLRRIGGAPVDALEVAAGKPREAQKP